MSLTHLLDGCHTDAARHDLADITYGLEQDSGKQKGPNNENAAYKGTCMPFTTPML